MPVVKDPSPRNGFWSWLAEHPFDALLVAFPAALALHHWGASDLAIFIASSLAIVPLAGFMGRATEQLAARLGPAIGGLINATFGNAAELLLALVALWQGPKMYPLVKASITGSIIGNVLLVLGMAILAGGLKHKVQRFHRPTAGTGATLLALATIGLIMPTLYYYVFATSRPLQPEQLRTVEWLSEEIAIILAVVYVLSLVYSLGTHRKIIAAQTRELAQTTDESHGPLWTRRRAITVLVVATVAVGVMSELLVNSAENAAASLGMSSVFVGVVVVAVIGNAAEHSSAILMAMKNQMDLAVNIAVGSGIQIALFVAPVLLLASMGMGHEHPLDLHFTPLEVIAVTISIVVLSLICHDGETNWLEGVMLLAVYAILALAFYHLGEIAGPEELAP